jgi:hypothetical protein
MRALIPPNPSATLLRSCGQAFAALALLAAALSGAQTPMPPAAQTKQAARAHKTVHPRKKPAAAAASAPVVPVVPAAAVPEKPAEPEAPPFPINDKAAQATVTWNSQGLRIDATNSSLEQILTDVSTATGTKVEGLNADQRVFGAFGPGPARDVLSQLLHGSGYNVLMIGDQGQGTPRKIVLSSPHPGSTPQGVTPTQESDEDADAEEQQQPQQQQQGPPNRAFPPGMQGRMPQRQPMPTAQPSAPQN